MGKRILLNIQLFIAAFLLFFLLFVPLFVRDGEYMTVFGYIRCSRDVDMVGVYSAGIFAYLGSIILFSMARRYMKWGCKYHIETSMLSFVGTAGLFVFPYMYYDLMNVYPRTTWNLSLSTLNIMFVLPVVTVFVCLAVVFSDRNQDKSKNVLPKQQAATDAATGKQTFQAGDLVVDSQGNQMKVEGYANGLYSCSKRNMLIGDFSEEELQQFDDYVNSFNRK